ncbi:hypothetical protein CsatB_030135 [Cannabis sativa]
MNFEAQPMWLAPDAAAMPPQLPQQGELQLPFLRDKRYAFHGQIMMLIVFAIFSIFICFVAIVPCLHRLRKAEIERRELGERPGCCFFPPLAKQTSHEENSHPS